MGARRIGVLSAPAVGCVPAQRTVGGGLERKCAGYANAAAIAFNSKLTTKLNTLNRNFPDAKLVYLESYSTLLYLTQNAASYGKYYQLMCSFIPTFEMLEHHIYGFPYHEIQHKVE